MKITIFSLTVGLVLIFLFFCLKKQEAKDNPNRVYFTIPAEDRKILVPVQFHDSITANLAFDTGITHGAIMYLDSTFIVQHPCILSEEVSDTLQGGVAWSELRYRSLRYNTPLTIKTGNSELRYDIVDVMNWKRYMGSNLSDGLFTIPQNDTTHVWELNFEHNYIEIHPAENFIMPENCILFPFVKNKFYPFNIQLPMKIQCTDGDTLTINRTFMIDTGMSWDVALMCRTEELEFFNKKEAVWTSYLDSYFRHYEVKATLFDNFVIDSLRIYTFDYSNYVDAESYLIGQHFLKHFNVFFDLKKQRLGLQPIKNFQRVVNSSYRRFHIQFYVTSEEKLVVTKLADNKGNYYKTSGLQEGDEIVAIAGERSSRDELKRAKGFRYDDKYLYDKYDTVVFDIKRKGKPMKIVVPIDKNEAQGD